MKKLIFLLPALAAAALCAGCRSGTADQALAQARDSVAMLTLRLDSIEAPRHPFSLALAASRDSASLLLAKGRVDEAMSLLVSALSEYPDSATHRLALDVIVKKAAATAAAAAKAQPRPAPQKKSHGTHMEECRACWGSGRGVKMVGRPAEPCWNCGGRGWTIEED